MSYIGQGLPADTFQGFTTDKFTGDGTANKAFTLTKEPFSEDTILVTIDGVVQEPTDDFTVSGTTLTLVGTAANNSEINVTHMGGPLPIGGAAELDLNGASDKLVLDADGDTTISADTNDQINIKVGGTDVFNILGSKLIVGDTASHTDDFLQIESPASGGGHGIQIRRNDSNTDQNVGRLLFGNNTDTDLATISAKTDGANDSGALLFSTQVASGSSAEKMRIDSSGNVMVAVTTANAEGGVTIDADGALNGTSQIRFNRANTTEVSFPLSFMNNSGTVGYVSYNNSATTYATNSDYRLKENVVTDWDATTRLKQLKPSRFNFKVDADTILDGFLAHEVSSIVPEAIIGDKDATETKEKVVLNSNGHVIAEGIEEDDWTAGKVADEEGNTKYPTDSTWEASKVVPVYQGIDQSKLVPLMVKTIQELEARIKTLEDA